MRGPGSVVGIVTGYRLDSPGIESRWGVRFSAPVLTGPGAHPASCTMSTGSFPGRKSGRGVTLTSHPLLVPWSKKGYSYISTPPMGRTACTEPQRLYKGALYLYSRRNFSPVVAAPPHGTRCLLAPGLPRILFRHNCDTFWSWEHSILEALQMRTEESAYNIDSNHSGPTIGHVQSLCRGLLEAGDAGGPLHEANDPNSVIS
jgi:hypothetical protein